MYMVTRHYKPGTALSMQEAWIIAPIKVECTLAIHTQHRRYGEVRSAAGSMG
jgi:hypothetical protein